MPTDSRRGFLRATLGACWTGAALLEQSVFRANQARAQAAAGLPSLFDIQKVADGIYAAIAKPEALLNCNAAIFENAADLLIVDTHSKPSAVSALVAQIRREITKKPVRYIVNSHFHWDHTQGAAAYRRIAPHADLVASEATRRLISENGAQRLKDSREETQASIERYQKQLSDTTSPQDKQQLERLIRESKSYLREMANYTPELPNVTFDRDLIIHDSAHDLHLMFRGRAHTAGDVFVFCPQKKVIASGDVLHGFFPYIRDAYPKDWVNTLLRVAEVPFDHVIGGHAAVQSGKQRLYQEANYLEELSSLVQQEKGRRKPLADIQQSITPDKLKSLEDGGYGAFLLDGLRKFTVAIPGAPASIADSVKGNVADVYNTLDRS